MSRLTMQLFFSLLAVVALSGAVLLLGSRLLGRMVRPLRSFEALIAPSAVWLAWLVAATCMGGSLYFSEVVGLPPCHLCWLQRFAMYPLVLVLAVAGVTSGPVRTWARRYGMLAAVVGACISSWHYLIEWYPTLEPRNVCQLSNPCTTVWFRRMGFVTIPFMALCGFLAVFFLLNARPDDRPGATDADDAEYEPDPAELLSGADGR